ncbi:MAG: galactokinase [Flavisolibacter sp.]|jgi:galactokinase|nr:galactokinase [Flavisolibacter sp.]
MNHEIVVEISSVFELMFGSKPRLFRSPGRVNIIGEHTDYNEGFVLPAAIDKAIYVGIAAREDNKIRLQTLEFDDAITTDLDSLVPDDKGWPNYVLGVAQQLQKRGYTIGGFDMVFNGDVPIGSGLSSSAAVECATAFALNEIFSLGISKKDLAFIAQKAEHEFAGVMCGIMDQFASVFGKEQHVIHLDCRSIEFEYVPLQMEGYAFLLLNTNVKHALASTEYNTRRQQCERGVALVQEHVEGVRSLRDISMEQLDRWVRPVEDIVYQRCKYVIEENQRLLAAVEHLKNGDLAALGKEMFESHNGLSTLYDVSCRELDFLVDFVKKEPAVLGARMMGGGFGGCTINLIKEDAIEELVSKITPAYQEAMELQLDHYIAKTANGSAEIKPEFPESLMPEKI